ncbi:MAG: hypothetical protein COZ06_33020 [Armatimonadetes bacterium CG_4_10_14_3_um_filter_66_18]|nr:NfeD family protein [Armatimonadota bacterium]OIP07702.1 MAG: hypothetical protein AUJ96_06885 [Armatimonadetes bacterium CG2_30_66_41]PIX49373.1 MAG: hypothetical protein COZ57_03540 [Armatimonadetes bacterium CG_4_8_14_3_um_filter_66_20]PIY37405.1 MAG: hypothetical protein COZ06_33020 [Armatimonadetes bacterium CG_4_10_14_3_um_filter_66_18]PIZ35102.1 MAG: hypothetical protein COY42_27425 [Armatimonadetes bacterium CG_4_10_14_0_8_um_filter_66_14]PJB67501.1 MAG: hypothetical protein CO096_1
MHPGYCWLTMTVFLLIMEVLTPGTFFMASLAMGTLVAGLVAFVTSAAWAQWAVFCAVTPATVVVCRRLVTRLDKSLAVPMNVDALIGRTAQVTQRIDAAGTAGRIRVDAQDWRAVADRDIAEGENVEVREVRGTRLFVS